MYTVKNSEGVGSYIRSDSNAAILHITIAVVLAIAQF